MKLSNIYILGSLTLLLTLVILGCRVWSIDLHLDPYRDALEFSASGSHAIVKEHDSVRTNLSVEGTIRPPLVKSK